MHVIDTHSHIYTKEFKEDLIEVEKRAKEVGVCNILLPNIDIDSIIPLKTLYQSNKNFYKPMMGLHPTSVNQNWEQNLNIIEKEFLEGDYIAIGEIGIDLYWDKTFLNEQIVVFKKQLEWAVQYNKPIAIHSREAHQYIIKSLTEIGSQKLRGVFHSFSGTEKELEDILRLDNFYIGINGVVTFKNSTLPTILKGCPMDKILLETDAPYLSPVPFRGKRNEPAHLRYIISKIADIYGTDTETVVEKTFKNAIELFSIN